MVHPTTIRIPSFIGFVFFASFSFVATQLEVLRWNISPSYSQEPLLFFEEQLPKMDKPRSIAWLMSFPNSGTSYTLQMVKHVTRQLTASNYGMNNRGPQGVSMPVWDDQPNGPYWSDPDLHPSYGMPYPNVLVKTHCGCRCERCGPTVYIETTFHFRGRCLTGTFRQANDTVVTVQYSPKRVRKAIHLFRDPFDNVVSRFHLEAHQATNNWTSSREGFLEFCTWLNSEFEDEERSHKMWKDDQVWEMLKDVPCRADFVRYIEWHNLALLTRQDMGLDSLVIHYEDYEKDWNKTTASILTFLEMEMVTEAAPFISGKNYHDYFTVQEKRQVKQALEHMALRGTYEQIQHYLVDL